MCGRFSQGEPSHRISDYFGAYPDEDLPAGLYQIIERTLKNPPTAYPQAWFDRLAWWQHPRAFFEKYDLLLTPTIACPPFRVGLDNPTEIAGRPVQPYAWIPFTYPFNLTGQPASSVPCGFSKDGLPIGLQIVGRRYDDMTVMRASAAFEKARPWIHGFMSLAPSMMMTRSPSRRGAWVMCR